MKKLVRMEYNTKTQELSMSKRTYKFKEGEKSKEFPVSIKGDDFYHPDNYIFYYETDKYDEAKDYFYSLDVDFNNCNYLNLQKYSIKINKN